MDLSDPNVAFNIFWVYAVIAVTLPAVVYQCVRLAAKAWFDKKQEYITRLQNSVQEKVDAPIERKRPRRTASSA